MLKFKSLLKRIISRLFKGKNQLLYINGEETLPPPLDPETEEKMIETIETEESRCILIEHNLRLVAFIAKRFENTGANIEELISIGTLGLMKAVSSFKKDKNIKLATYASRCIENEILMYIRKTANQKTEVSLDEPINMDYDGNELLLSDILGTEVDCVTSRLEDDVDLLLLRQALSQLNERERLIINMRFGLQGHQEQTQKEVAQQLGISQSYISRLEKRIMARLKKEMLRQTACI